MPVCASTRLLGAAVCDLADPTLALPFARDRAAHATALLGALPFVADDNDRADWHSQFLLLRFCSITRGRWLPRVMPMRMIQEYIARVDGQHDRHIARILLGSADAEMPDAADAQLQLPPRLSGLGLTSVSSRAAASALASWSATLRLVAAHVAGLPALADLGSRRGLRRIVNRDDDPLGLLAAYADARDDYDTTTGTPVASSPTGPANPRASTTTATATPATCRRGPTRNSPSTCHPPHGGALAPLVIPSANRTFWG